MTHQYVTNEDLEKNINALRVQREADLQLLREEHARDMKDIMDLLKPLAETYKTASTMGKWIMAAAVFISIMLGIILSLQSFFKK